MSTTHRFYWWNLENLFDIENSPRRSDFLERTLDSELRGWTQSILDTKINNLTSIITQFNNNAGPDILGVCEVENLHVLNLLASRMVSSLNRNYQVQHLDSEDKRGIDTALIFDADKYIAEDLVFTLRIIKRNPTRDLQQFHIRTQSGNDLVIVLNHWPSRSGGVFESEPYRIMVAENLAYWVERIYEERGRDTDIILMGDFNDNPFDRSISNYLMAVKNRNKVIYARNKKFYNPMYEFMSSQWGTHVYNGEQNILDQFMLSKSIISNNSRFPFKYISTEIIAFPELISGRYKTPVRFGRPSSSINRNGYSDHLPIELTLNES